MNPRIDHLTHFYIHDGLVNRPKPKSIYHIDYDKRDVTITFNGNNVEDYSYYDLSAGYGLLGKSGKLIQTTADFVSKESLPPSYRMMSLPPIMRITSKDSLKHIEMVNKIEINLNNDNLHLISYTDNQSFSLKAYNQEIQDKYQKLVQVPLTTGQYPIFLDNKKTSVEELKKIYQNFIDANPDEKLSEQRKLSKDHCHIRAKVMIDYLRDVYDYDVLRIYKIWNRKDWKEFGIEDGWAWHCASLPMLGMENIPYVCDPWVGFNKKLLTLPEWIHKSDQPTPKKVIITNQAVIHNYEIGKIIDAPHFFETQGSGYVNSYKNVATSAFPQYPLAENDFSFFKAKLALQKRKGEVIEDSITLKN
jgi:hypothetical protein